jgi:hypothetical protein
MVWTACNASWESLLKHSEPYLDDPLRFRAQLESFDEANPSIFVMGSSQPREDVDAEALNHALMIGENAEGRVVNLGVSGGWTVVMYLQLDLVLKNRPDVIIAMPYWRGFYQEYDVAKTKNYLYSLDTFTYLFKKHEPRQFFQRYKNYLIGCFLANVMPSYRYRKSLVSILSNAILGKNKRTALVQFSHHDSKPADYFDSELKKRESQVLAPISETDMQKEIFSDFVTRIQGSGSRLIVVEPPWHPRIVELSDQEGEAWEDYLEFVVSLSDELSFEYVGINELPTFKAADFISFAYLNDSGREKMTHFLIDLIRKKIPAFRK